MKENENHKKKKRKPIMHTFRFFYFSISPCVELFSTF